MIKKSLITTALEDTWPKEGSLIFLGSWCCSFSRRDYWSTLDYQIEPYHWDDREKLSRDYKDLELIYEEYLVVFAKKLNEIHRTELSNRFWRILIGPWLYTFIHVVFDRWYMLKNTIEANDSPQFKTFGNNFSALVTNDIDSFNHAIETDHWNETLYSQLVKVFFSDEVSITYVDKNSNYRKSKINKSKKLFIKGNLAKLSNLISALFTDSKDIFVIAPHMSIWKQILLHIKLRQFPVFWFRDVKVFTPKKVFSSRETVVLQCEAGVMPEFETVLNETAFKLIPKIYLEGFQALLNASRQQGWPKNPKAIFTSNSYASDETFKCWAGCQVDAGSKLIIGQHGGNFGMTPMAIHEAHQIKISDKWFSWGWKDQKQSKIFPVGNFKSTHRKIKHRPNGNVLLVSMTLSRFSYYLYSVPIAGQVGDYLDDQLEFANSLTKEIRQKLRIRLYPLDRGWSQKARWQLFDDQISFDESSLPLMKSLSRSRIFIGTYNATTYLEAFTANMPSILFWNPKHWEITMEANIYFQRLREVGILHDCPKKAAAHLINIWDNIDEWWFSDQVQDAVRYFTDYYSRDNPQIIDSVVKQIMSD